MKTNYYIKIYDVLLISEYRIKFKKNAEFDNSVKETKTFFIRIL